MEEVKISLISDLEKVNDLKELNDLKVEYLGKKGFLSGLSSNMGKLQPSERAEFGKKINDVRNAITLALEEKKKELEEKEAKLELDKQKEEEFEEPLFFDENTLAKQAEEMKKDDDDEEATVEEFSLENNEYIPNYNESISIINSLFPKDKYIFLMCGGGGYASMTKNLLISLGYDQNKIYNVVVK